MYITQIQGIFVISNLKLKIMTHKEEFFLKQNAQSKGCERLIHDLKALIEIIKLMDGKTLNKSFITKATPFLRFTYVIIKETVATLAITELNARYFYDNGNFAGRVHREVRFNIKTNESGRIIASETVVDIENTISTLGAYREQIALCLENYDMYMAKNEAIQQAIKSYKKEANPLMRLNIDISSFY